MQSITDIIIMYIDGLIKQWRAIDHQRIKLNESVSVNTFF